MVPAEHKPEQKRTTVFFLWIVGLAAVVVLVMAIRSLTRTVVPVSVAQVTRENLVNTIPTNGKVEPVAEFQAHPGQAGVVQKIYVHVNEQVSPGTLLLRMDDNDAQSRVATAQAALASALVAQRDVTQGSPEENQRQTQDLASAKLERDNADHDLAVLKRLQGQGAASAAEVMRAQQRLQAAQVTLSNAQTRSGSRFGPVDVASSRARIADAKASLAAAQGNLANLDIRSPIAGTVYAIPISAFDYVQPQEDLMDVADLSHLKVRAYFDEPEIGKLAVGQPVQIVWEAKLNRVWHGHIIQAPSTIMTYSSRNVGECIISVDDAHGDLLPNTNVTVTVTTSQRNAVLGIPREALHTEGSHDFVYQIQNGRLVKTPVRVGDVNLLRVEVLSGLHEGDTIVLGSTVPGQDLSPGLQVKSVP